MFRSALAAALLLPSVLLSACSCSPAQESDAERKIAASLGDAQARPQSVAVFHDGDLTASQLGDLGRTGVSTLLRFPGMFTAVAAGEQLRRLAALPWVTRIEENPEAKFDMLLRSRLHQLSGTGAAGGQLRFHGECRVAVDAELRGMLTGCGVTVYTAAGTLFTAAGGVDALYRCALLGQVLRLEGERSVDIQH
jgi:hypothetical protein